MPIEYDAPPQQFDMLLASVNGFLFTGGGNDFVDANGEPNAFSLAARRVLEATRGSEESRTVASKLQPEPNVPSMGG